MPNPAFCKHRVVKNRFRWVAVALMTAIIIGLQTVPGYAQEPPDPEEIRQKEAEIKTEITPRGKWLPVPIFITEPAIGNGLGASLAYFHPLKEGDDTSDQASADQTENGSGGKKPTPNITGIAAGYTESGTWAAAIGHSHHWRQDSIRYAGGLAYADVYSQIYLLDIPFNFNLQGMGLFQQVSFRLGQSNFFLGGKLLWLQTKSAFDVTISEDIEIGVEDIESSDVGIALTGSYDTRDNPFTPNNGQNINLALWRYDESLGGDHEYWKASLKALSFHQLHPRFVLGLRLQTAVVDGRPPFYAYPWVSLRGIPAMRYQGKQAGEIEVEGRWNILPRWALLGFGGLGAVGGNDASFQTDQDIYSAGVGVRYFLMRDLGLWLGVDVARGPEEWYTYITVGQAWGK